MRSLRKLRRAAGRLFRFRLRTLFLVLTLLCLFLGLYVKQARDQQKAAEAVQAWGGTIVLDFQSGSAADDAQPLAPAIQVWGRGVAVKAAPPPPPRLKWFRELLGDQYFSNVVSVTIPYHVAADTNIGTLRAFRHLRILNLSGTHTNDDDLRTIAGFKKLEVLRLADADITDDGIQWLAQLPALKTLSLRGTMVSNAGFLELRQHKLLQYIDVSDTFVTVGGVRQMHIDCPNCTVDSTARVTRRELEW